MSNVKHGFEKKVVEIPIEKILSGAKLARHALNSTKFRTIVGSVAELGVIEPLAVFPSSRSPGNFDLLDGRLRLEALKQLGRATAPCMVSTDDEGFTFNRHITRLSAVQEHRMIRAALAKGASERRIAEALRMDVSKIRERASLLDGIAPEAASLLKNQQVIPKIFTLLKKMKPFRQIEAAEMMLAANKFTSTYAEMILATTRADGLVDGAKPKKKGAISAEDLAKLEAEMERLRQDCHVVEEEIGDTMISLVVAKSFVARLLRNETIHAHLQRHHSESLLSLVTTLEAIAADNRAGESE
ncbi:plasmid partitioning protein RepB C-terminal domain-containing protein [Caballeronia sp. TF1N1]|uniref:plasmid partitioning protein RepB C-terminal domain-containing protein n=1 Tax=Caballeronia sp. TF1N1 TaxID=2878153 RepID=UPI001FD183F9|nr:plasmid partitioning protein RepB C-terminal domain-containing protein [Caballeronia sp. TF1N1]